MDGETIAVEKRTRRERGTGRIWKIGFKEEPAKDSEERALWKKRVWWIQYYDAQGRKRRESSKSKTFQVAERLLRRRLTAREDGTLSDPKITRLSYREMRDAYLDFYQLKKRKSLRFDKEGKPYLDKVKRLDGFFEDYRAREITSDAIRQFVLKLQGEKKQDSTINRSLAALRTMFRMAVRERKIGLAAMPIFTFLTEPKPRQGLLDQKKYAELLGALPDYVKTALAIGFHTGMRRGEVLTLRWEHVDFDERLIRLDPALTKTGESREIPISDELFGILKARYLQRNHTCPFVNFRTDHDGRVIAVGDFRKVWKRCCGKLGQADLRFHDLRRTFVTTADRAGVPRADAMGMSGHRTESVYRRYSISNPDSKRAAIEKMGAYRAAQNGAKTGQIANSEAPRQEAAPTVIN